MKSKCITLNQIQKTTLSTGLALFAFFSILSYYCNVNASVPNRADEAQVQLVGQGSVGLSTQAVAPSADILSDKELTIKVPYNYSDPDSGTFDLYARIHGKFETKLQTVVVISGGPGLSSETVVPYAQSIRQTGFNVITFDQRGIKRSAFGDRRKLNDFNVLNSANTARDIEMIRRTLKIENLVLWSWGYGTIPARIYGNLYPQKTKHIVAFSPYPHFWNRPAVFLAELSNSFVATLTEQQRTRFNNLSEMAKTYFPYIFQESLTSFGKKGFDLTAENFRSGLSSDILDQEKFLTDVYHQSQAQLYNRAVSLKYTLPKDDWSEEVYSNLSIWESGISELGIQSTIKYSPIRGFVAMKPWSEENLVDVLQNLAKSPTLYDPARYPLTVPITYIVGGYDPTLSPGTLDRLKNRVGSENSRTLSFADEGHYAGVSPILEDDPISLKYRATILPKILNRKPISQEELAEIGAQQIE